MAKGNLQVHKYGKQQVKTSGSNTNYLPNKFLHISETKKYSLDHRSALTVSSERGPVSLFFVQGERFPHKLEHLEHQRSHGNTHAGS